MLNGCQRGGSQVRTVHRVWWGCGRASTGKGRWPQAWEGPDTPQQPPHPRRVSLHGGHATPCHLTLTIATTQIKELRLRKASDSLVVTHLCDGLNASLTP